MAPRKRKVTPKPESSSKEDHKENDQQSMPEEVLRILEELQQQALGRIEQLHGVGDSIVEKFKHQAHVWLERLPKEVRKMPMKQFMEQHGSSISSSLLEDLRSCFKTSVAATTPATTLRAMALPGTATAVATSQRTRAGISAAAAERPAEGPAGRLLAATLMRQPKAGEILYSHNGSPLGVLEQQRGKHGVLKTRLKGGEVEQTPMLTACQSHQGSAVATVIHQERPGSKTGVADGIVITLKGGQQVQVDFDDGLEKLPKAQRKEVAAHLEALEKLTRSALSTVNKRR